MNIKSLIGVVIETILKVVVVAAVIMVVFRGATKAYDFGYKVFADEPLSLTGGRTITVGIAEGAGVKEIAEMLQEKGLIEDASLFIVQELLSAYHDEIQPGIYDLSTDMTAEQMLAIMSAPPKEDADLNNENKADSGGEGETENEEDTEAGNAGEEAGEDTSGENAEGMAGE